jgi:hypothetical protein
MGSSMEVAVGGIGQDFIVPFGEKGMYVFSSCLLLSIRIARRKLSSAWMRSLIGVRDAGQMSAR